MDPRLILAVFALFYLIVLISFGDSVPVKIQHHEDIENPEEIENKVDQQIDDLVRALDPYFCCSCQSFLTFDTALVFYRNHS